MLVRRGFRRGGKVSERFMGEQYQNISYIHAENWQGKKKRKDMQAGAWSTLKLV